MNNIKIFLRCGRVIPLMVMTVCGVTLMDTVSFAETSKSDMKEIKAKQFVEIYDDMEKELLRRFEEQKKKESPDLFDTIESLGYIRSKKAIPLLLQNIDIEPNFSNKKVGDFYPVQVVGAHTQEDIYVALRALRGIGGISLDQIIFEIERAKADSRRERLLVRLAILSYEKAFIDRANSQKKSDITKWERVLKLCGEK